MSEIFIQDLKMAMLNQDGDTVIAMCTSEQMSVEDLEEVLSDLDYLKDTDHYWYDPVAHYKYLLHLFDSYTSQNQQ